MPKYGVHVNKYYVPDDVPSWAKLNLKQASKKIAKTRRGDQAGAGEKAKTAVKLANRKGGRGKRIRRIRILRGIFRWRRI